MLVGFPRRAVINHWRAGRRSVRQPGDGAYGVVSRGGRRNCTLFCLASASRQQKSSHHRANERVLPLTRMTADDRIVCDWRRARSSRKWKIKTSSVVSEHHNHRNLLTTCECQLRLARTLSDESRYRCVVLILRRNKEYCYFASAAVAVVSSRLSASSSTSLSDCRSASFTFC